jgi:Flp pilus assembly protein CpaB
VGRRWNVLVVAGVACFIVGVAIVLLLARDDSDAAASRASADTVPVLVAKEDVTPGTTGASRSVALAKGKEAVAVSVPFVQSGAGFVAPGDVVNIYQVFPDTVAALNETGQQVAAGGIPYAAPRVELLLTNVRVLDVLGAGATPLITPTVANNPAGTSATTSAPASTGAVTVILEVDTVDAEKVIFGSTIQKLSLYLTRVGDNPPAGSTPGRDYGNQLQEEPDAAFSRANP